MLIRASALAPWLVVAGLELCSAAGSLEARLAWRLCSGGVLCCTLAFPSIWSTLAEMLCISERMELWLDAISSRSCLSIEVKFPSESRQWWRCFFLSRRHCGEDEAEDISTLTLDEARKRPIIDGTWRII